MLLMTPMGHWHDTLGDIMLFSGIAGMLITGIGALRRDHSQRSPPPVFAGGVLWPDCQPSCYILDRSRRANPPSLNLG